MVKPLPGKMSADVPTKVTLTSISIFQCISRSFGPVEEPYRASLNQRSNNLSGEMISFELLPDLRHTRLTQYPQYDPRTSTG